MAPTRRPDVTQESLVAILRQLNQAENRGEGDQREQALELGEIASRLEGNVLKGPGAINLAVGLLLRKGLVKASGSGDYSWQRQRTARQRYQITAEGKKYLVDTAVASGRVP